MLHGIMLGKIQYMSIDNNKLAERSITVVFGQPFYKSSGINSEAANTWFPFYGISTKEIEIEEGTLPIGWFIKNMAMHGFDKRMVAEIKEACRFKSDNGEFAEDLMDRFINLPCLLISSQLGGGVWEKNGFKNLKKDLMRQYPDFYTNFPSFEFSSQTLTVDCKVKDINKIQKVNNWLIENSTNNAIKTLADIKNNSLKTVEQLQAFEPNNSQPRK